MQAASTSSKSRPLQSLITHASGLAGLLVFLNQAWGYTPLEHTILTSLGVGMATYLVLTLVYVIVQRILTHTPPEAAASNGAEDTTSDTVSKTSARAAATSSARPAAENHKKPERRPEPQAA